MSILTAGWRWISRQWWGLRWRGIGSNTLTPEQLREGLEVAKRHGLSEEEE